MSRQPRIRVAALVTIDGNAVLVRHRKDDATYYLLPGGGVAWGESLAEAVHREVAEETGLEIEAGSLLLVNDTIDPSGERHVVNVTFEGTVVGGRIAQTSEDPRVEGVELVAPAMLTEIDLRPPLGRQLQDVLSGRPAAGYVGSVFNPG